MRTSFRHFRPALLLLGVVVVSGCSTTTLKGEERFRGELVDTTELDPEVEDRAEVLQVSHNGIALEQRTKYSRATRHDYQLMLRKNYLTERSAPDVGSIIVAPFALACMPFLILALENPFECFGSMVTTSYDPHSEEQPLPGKFDTEIVRTTQTETQPLTGRSVAVYLNGAKAAEFVTDSRGTASFDLGQLLIASRLQPKQLVHGQALTVSAEGASARGSVRYTNDAIPEAFFQKRYEAQRESLMASNNARHGNCSIVAQSRREFYECYYQKGLLTN